MPGFADAPSLYISKKKQVRELALSIGHASSSLLCIPIIVITRRLVIRGFGNEVRERTPEMARREVSPDVRCHPTEKWPGREVSPTEKWREVSPDRKVGADVTVSPDRT
jgi:hypothetical protein